MCLHPKWPSHSKETPARVPRRSQGLHLPAWRHGHPKWGSEGSRAQGQDHSRRCHPTRGHKMGIPRPKALVAQNQKAAPGVCSPGWQLSRGGTGTGLCEVQWCHIFSPEPGENQSSGHHSCPTTPLLPSTPNTTSKTQALLASVSTYPWGRPRQPLPIICLCST